MRKKTYIPIILIAVISVAAFLLYFPDAKNYFSSVVSTDAEIDTNTETDVVF